jgi:hypothetical protein
VREFTLVISISMMSTAAFAATKSYDCRGKDLKNQNVRFVITEESPLSSYRDLTLKINKRPTQVYKHVAASTAEGIDLSLATPQSLYWIHEPPNMLGGDKIAASYFTDGNYSIEKRAILTCTTK